MQNLTQSALDALRQPDLIKLATLLEKSDLLPERALHRTKWFDYRFMSPLQATIHFHEVYQGLFRAKFRKYFDVAEAEFKTGVGRKGLIHPGRAFTATWRSRQFADALGVPYGLFIDEVMELFAACSWRRIPHINQLIAGKNRDRITKVVLEKWDQMMDSRLLVSELPQYRMPVFRGLHSQHDHQEWILDQLSRHHGNPRHIADAWLIRPLLSESRLRERWDDDRLRRARDSAAGWAPKPAEPVSALDMVPSCFGLPGAVDQNSHCKECSLLRECTVSVEAASDAVRTLHGSDDPRAELRKRRQRERTARCRKNAAAARKAVPVGTTFSLMTTSAIS